MNINWSGLFNWSTQHHDGTKASTFEAMSDEDRQWLEGAMKQYTYDEADRLKEICKDLKHAEEVGFDAAQGAKSGDDMIHLLEEL